MNCIFLRSPDHKGNIANWTENHWWINSTENQKLEVELSSMCNSKRAVILPRMMKFSAFTHQCKILKGKPTFIGNQTSLQQALELMTNASCRKYIHEETVSFQGAFLATRFLSVDSL